MEAFKLDRYIFCIHDDMYFVGICPLIAELSAKNVYTRNIELTVGGRRITAGILLVINHLEACLPHQRLLIGQQKFPEFQKYLICQQAYYHCIIIAILAIKWTTLYLPSIIIVQVSVFTWYLSPANLNCFQCGSLGEYTTWITELALITNDFLLI